MDLKDVLTVPAEAPVLEAAQIMRDHHVGCLVVVDRSGELVGILSERDLLNRVLASRLDPQTTRARDVMTDNVATCPVGTSIGEACEVMTGRSIRHLPVVDGGRAVGVISAREVMADQLSRNKAMKAAAEQIALLTTCLKSLDFDEVINMVGSEVPKLFGAQRCVLCLPKDGHRDGASGLVYRHNCLAQERDLRSRADLGNKPDQPATMHESTPEFCRKLDCKGTSVTIPLRVAGFSDPGAGTAESVTGYLCMCSTQPGDSLAADLVRYKCSLIQEILNANLTNARLYQEVRRRSLTDPLTGVGTRRVFEERLEGECVRADRYGRPFCVAIVDVDHFKNINDRLGHVSGDRALSELARCMLGQKRKSDLLARYGGDEFVLLMPETALADALTVLERIRDHVQGFETPDGVSMTVSCGVVERSSEAKEPPNELIRRADVALYEAKRNGRNRIQAWNEAEGEHSFGAPVASSRVGELQDRLDELSARSKEMFVQSIWGLIRALEAKDPYTKNHSENVMRYAVGISQTMRIDAPELAVVRRAAMIHDIGKIGVPDSILRKPGALTPAERRVMEQHPLIAVRILSQMRFLEREIPIVRHHHEHWSGRGYPDGLEGSAIPPGARILAVADAFDAITSDRVYRESRPLAKAMRILKAEAGRQFDGEVVEAMVRWTEDVQGKLDEPKEVTARDLLDSQRACKVAA